MIESYEVFHHKKGKDILTGLAEFDDIEHVLTGFVFDSNDLLAGGGGKSLIATRINDAFKSIGWVERSVALNLSQYGGVGHYNTHRIDCLKNRVAMEIEWNNKDPFFHRDLVNMRLLYEHGLIDVGVIITRSTSLNMVFRRLEESHGLSKTKYVSSTTHMDNLTPLIQCNVAGDCPIVAFGITKELMV